MLGNLTLFIIAQNYSRDDINNLIIGKMKNLLNFKENKINVT